MKFGMQIHNVMPLSTHGVKIETGRGIPIWRPAIFQTGSSFISAYL